MTTSFEDKFDIDNLTIIKTELWTWSLRPCQTTLGSSILSLNRYSTSLKDITIEEAIDYFRTIKIIEETINKVYHPNKFNYLSLMMIDDQVHTHVIPRYSNTVTTFGKNWKDDNWPNQITLNSIPTKKETLQKIIATLKNIVNQPK